MKKSERINLIALLISVVVILIGVFISTILESKTLLIIFLSLIIVWLIWGTVTEGL